MNRKILVLLAIILIAILAIAVIAIKQKRAAQNPEISKQELQQKFQTLKIQYEKAKADGYDVSEVESLGKQAKQAFDKGNYKKADELVKRIFVLLRKTEISETPATPSVPTPVPIDDPTPTPIPSVSSLSQVKNAIVYERLGDARPKRTTDEQIQILKDTKADMIFRATWRWQPMPNSCSEFEADKKQLCENSGYSFENFRNTIQKIKQEIPGIIIVGAVPAQKINKNEVNEKTGETFNVDQVWEMALNPAKWGIESPTKEEFQNKISPSIGGGYYPDITNPVFQELLLSWAENQIDAGMDGVWIDLLYTQSAQLAKMTQSATHNSVKESFEAASEIVNMIHKYGLSKNKNVYVGSWAFAATKLSFGVPNLDFVTVTPTSQEVLNGEFDEKEWDNKKQDIKEIFNDIPIFAFVDWSDDGAPISVFSQKLNIEKQNEFIRKSNEFYLGKGINFVYPVHGGYTGKSSLILAYGQYGWYDSLAPEFDTYETIKELANKKLAK